MLGLDGLFLLQSFCKNIYTKSLKLYEFRQTTYVFGRWLAHCAVSMYVHFTSYRLGRTHVLPTAEVRATSPSTCSAAINFLCVYEASLESLIVYDVI